MKSLESLVDLPMPDLDFPYESQRIEYYVVSLDNQTYIPKLLCRFYQDEYVDAVNYLNDRQFETPDLDLRLYRIKIISQCMP